MQVPPLLSPLTSLTEDQDLKMDPNRPFQGLQKTDLWHFHAHLRRVSDSDSSCNPPYSQHIPQFEHCGKDNCNNHHYPGIQWGPDRQFLGLDRAVNMHMLHCYGCCQPKSIVSLHILPCNHALCHDCLNKTVELLHENLQSGEVTHALGNALLRGGLAKQTDSAVLDNEVSELEHAALTMAGFFCCGQAIHLERFLYCMDREVALQFWLDTEYLLASFQQDPLDHCGWPDCGAFVPRWCIFEDMDGYGQDILHCPTCTGNSQFIRDGVWIPSGQNLRYYRAAYP